jgi:thymidylate synthase
MEQRYRDRWVGVEIDGVQEVNPRLVLNPDVTDFYDMTIDDFIMEDYTPMKPQLKLELGI